MTPPPATDSLAGRIKAYEDGVLDGTRPAGKLIRQAVERHRRDLADGHQRGLAFDTASAERIIRFYGFLKHSKGEWAGKPFVLSDWQEWLLWVLFGWKKRNGLRRFRTAYIELPRKNGKSTLLSGISLYLLDADGEPGSEVYAAATTRDQAKRVFEEAQNMVAKSPALRRRITNYRNSLSVTASLSKFLPVSSDHNTLDGLNPHGCVIDELHKHKTRGIIDVMESATAARRQPMMVFITTAGSDPYSPCGELHTLARNILAQVINQDQVFCFVAAIDDEDDPWDNVNWKKANPNYGISVKPEDLESEAAIAKQMPSKRNEFLRLHLNKWTNQDECAIPIERWDACDQKFDPNTLLGEPCWCGLDLSKTGDLTAACLIFPPSGEGGCYRVLPYFWMPEDGAAEKSKTDRVPYLEWAKQGLIKLTPGNVTDYGFVRKQLNELAERFDIREVLFDPWNATQLAMELEQDGMRVVRFNQSFATFTEPTKKLLELVDGKQIAHNGHDVLRWNISNLSVKEDANQNLRPVKPERKTAKRIDGVVALIMGLGGASRSTQVKLECSVI